MQSTRIEDVIRIAEYEILEVTLRDGSYVIDYSFTADDTKKIALGLEEAGFRMIEIGHGLGINATNPPRCAKAAVCTDEEYLAAASVLKKAKFGMFLLPEVATEETVKKAAEYGMGFFRVGTNAPENEEAWPWIRLCKDLGFTVSYQAMKAYVMDPKQIAEIGKKAEAAGVDFMEVVDSSGGMFPDDVKEYIGELKKAVGIEVGFHGHNNLQMAVINTITALESGATILDASLRGMGRSGGNAQTEVLLCVLKKLGYPVRYDIYKTMDIGEYLVKPKMRVLQGIDHIDVIMGLADFHSSFYKNIKKVAQQFGLDERELIVEACKIDKVNTTEEVVRKGADSIISRRENVQ